MMVDKRRGRRAPTGLAPEPLLSSRILYDPRAGQVKWRSWWGWGTRF